MHLRVRLEGLQVFMEWKPNEGSTNNNDNDNDNDNYEIEKREKNIL